VRVLRYRQHKPDSTVVEADRLTNLTPVKVGRPSLYRTTKGRWEIENQGFNDAKNRYGLEHICHHHANGILVNWMLILLALVIERLYRILGLHRGRHPVRSDFRDLIPTELPKRLVPASLPSCTPASVI